MLRPLDPLDYFDNTDPLPERVRFWRQNDETITYSVPTAYMVWDRAGEIVGAVRSYYDVYHDTFWAAYEPRSGEYTWGVKDNEDLFESAEAAAAWLFMDTYGG